MFTIDNKEYRNLQEQVLKNKQDIAAHYAIDRVLAEFGIRVLGVVATYDDLDPDYVGEYGDAFAVGTQPPYVFYIWTRPDPAAGHDTAYWFNVGELAIVGPQGAPGTSIVDAELNEEDQLVFKFSDGRVITIPNSLKGEAGGSPSISLSPTDDGVTIKIYDAKGHLTQSASILNGMDGQSIKGDPGPAGPIVVIKGIITSISQLDGVTPTAPNEAYLLEEDGNKYIIGLVNGEWTNLGLFSGGTLVYVNGIIQNEFDADTKLDKITSTGYRRVYGVSSSGNQTAYNLLNTITPGSAGIRQIVCRDGDTENDENLGQIIVPEEPKQSYHAASKAYADTKLEKVTTSGDRRVYGIQGGGGQTTYRLTAAIDRSTLAIVCRDGTGSTTPDAGQIRVPDTPTQDYHAASKKYVDDKDKLYLHAISVNYEASGEMYFVRFQITTHDSTPYTALTMPNLAYVYLGGISGANTSYGEMSASHAIIENGVITLPLDHPEGWAQNIPLADSSLVDRVSILP